MSIEIPGEKLYFENDKNFGENKEASLFVLDITNIFINFLKGERILKSPFWLKSLEKMHT